MNKNTVESASATIVWASVDAIKPDEEGGPIARAGFNYQDEIAVSFLIDMLETDALLRVHCETHDDIILVRQNGHDQPRLAEFVQVKAGEPDKLWSVADISSRKSGKVGSSIFEISLSRDKHEETTAFRMVTLRPVVSELRPLTYPCGSPGRSMDTDAMKALCDELEKRFPNAVSPKGNGCGFWLQNCFWDERHTEEEVRKSNTLRLLQLSFKEDHALLPEQVEILLQELRVVAKEAGAAKWAPDPAKKIITRTALRGWWSERTTQFTGGAVPSGGKLQSKMSAAELPDDVITLATVLRRDYTAWSRTSKYLEPDEAERLQRRVLSEVASLRSRFVAGELTATAAQFHATCLDRMDAVNAERDHKTEDRAAFLKGCMYDIADRCLLRFARPA